MRSLSFRRLGRPAIAAGLVAAWLVAANLPAGAAGMAAPHSTRTAPEELSPAQAQAAAPASNVEANLARLHQQLKITPAQQPKFAAFANAMRENARLRPGAPRPNPSAVDDLRLAIEDSQLELTALKRLLPPMQALYASLSPAQQKTADQVFRQPPGGSTE